jgi:hypothetical protein
VPRNVGLNPTNYSREQFYADVTAMMRIDAAPLPLAQLGDPTVPASPLFRMAQALKQFQVSTRPPPSLPIAVHVKMYAYLQGEAVRQEIRQLTDLLERAVDTETRETFDRQLAKSLDTIRRSLWAYRRLRSELWPFEKLCHRSLVDAMRLADEYMSLFLEERLAGLSATLESDAAHYDGSGFAPRASAAISALAREEAQHRQKYGFLTLSASHGDAKEYFTYRMSLLKKAIHQALYLDAREVRRDTFVRNAIGAVGAALAAIWALATAVPAGIAGLPSDTKMLFMAMAVGAYVMKDRIKALTNEFLTKRLRKFDHTSWIYGRSLGAIGLGMLRARLRESMRFLRFDEVEDAVRQIRLERRTVRQVDATTAGEFVIQYRKSLLVESEDSLVNKLPEGYGFRDILRLNVRHFLVRLDDPSERVRFYDPDRGAFHDAKLPKVYHLNVVLRVKRGEDQDGERYEHLRVVLNKNGIVRVERVVPVKD